MSRPIPGRLLINGECREYGPGEAPTDLNDLVRSVGLEPATVVVELNGTIIKRGDYAACGLSDGDRVEIVRMVGGG
ncbi:MAG: sulfur carrier protein ThiS [Planctomycetota bacterium]|jgi:sulfur carrier protein|nr:sulfur carrier protein ThiS [Planctomycetota bacterium]